MKAAIQSSFIAFELTPTEELEAYQYTDCQIAGIQNLIASNAEELVSILITSDQLDLEQQKKLAYTKGQIDAMKYLLSRADTVREEQAAKQAEKDNSQSNSPENF